MKHYVGLDVSMKETAICIVDENGRICSEGKVFSHPEDLSRALTEKGFCIERIGLEAGPLSQWLYEGMAQAGLPVICVETRHTKAFLRAQINKSEPPRVYRRVCGSMIRLLFRQRSSLRRMPPLLRSA